MRGHRTPPLLLLLLPALSCTHVVQEGNPGSESASSASEPSHIIAAPSLPRIEAYSPLQTAWGSLHEQLGARQAAAPADPNAVADPEAPAQPVADPAVNPPAAPAEPPVDPAAQPVPTSSSSSTITTTSAPTITTIPSSTTLATALADGSLTDSYSTTVKWVETHITRPETTERTWIPITVTMVFAAAPDPWPQPVDGKIGYASYSQTAPVPLSTGDTGAGARLDSAGRSVGLVGAVAGAVGAGAGVFGLWS